MYNPYADYEGVDADDVDGRMSKLCNILKQAEQQAQDTLTYVLEEMKECLEVSGNREDIQNCIEEITTDVKHDESEHWRICDDWMEHFDNEAIKQD